MIYFIQASDFGPVKIGYTDNDIQTRLTGLQVSSYEQLNLLGYIDGDLCVEMKLHEIFKSLRIRGEWFTPEPCLLKCIHSLSNKNISIDEITSPLRITNKINLLIYENGVIVGKQKILGWSEQEIEKTISALKTINRTTKFEEFHDLSKY